MSIRYPEDGRSVFGELGRKYAVEAFRFIAMYNCKEHHATEEDYFLTSPTAYTTLALLVFLCPLDF